MDSEGPHPGSPSMNFMEAWMTARDKLIGLLHSSGFKSTKCMRAQFEETIKSVDVSIVKSLEEFTRGMLDGVLEEMRTAVKKAVAEEICSSAAPKVTSREAETQCDRPRRRRTRWGPPLTSNSMNSRDIGTQTSRHKPKESTQILSEEHAADECKKETRRRKKNQKKNQRKPRENRPISEEPKRSPIKENKSGKLNSWVVAPPTYSEVLKKNLKREEKRVGKDHYTPEEIRQRELEWMEDMEVFPMEAQEEKEDWTSDLERNILNYESRTMESVRMEVLNVPKSWDIKQLKDRLYSHNFKNVTARSTFDKNFCIGAKKNLFSTSWVLDIHPRFALRLYTQRKVFIGIGQDAKVQPLWDSKVANLFLKAGWNGQRH